MSNRWLSIVRLMPWSIACNGIVSGSWRCLARRKKKRTKTKRKKEKLRLLNSLKQLVLQPMKLTIKRLMIHPYWRQLVKQHQPLMPKSNAIGNHAPGPVRVVHAHALAAAVDRPAEVQQVDHEAAAAPARVAALDHATAVAQSLDHAHAAVHVHVRIHQLVHVAPSTVAVPLVVDPNPSLHQNPNRVVQVVVAVAVHLVHDLGLVPVRQAAHVVVHLVVRAPVLAAAQTKSERERDKRVNCNNINIHICNLRSKYTNCTN